VTVGDNKTHISGEVVRRRILLRLQLPLNTPHSLTHSPIHTNCSCHTINFLIMLTNMTDFFKLRVNAFLH